MYVIVYEPTGGDSRIEVVDSMSDVLNWIARWPRHNPRWPETLHIFEADELFGYDGATERSVS